MKRFRTFTLLVLVSAIAGTMLTGCDEYETRVSNDCFSGAANSKEVYISEYKWDGVTMEITIPNEMDGKPVTALGGTSSEGSEYFCISDATKEGLLPYDPPAEYQSLRDKALSADEIIYYDITLNIGKDMKNFYFSGTPFAYDLRVVDGKNVAYIYRFYINCDLENIWYYSEDGILYDSVNERPITSFFYWNETIK